MTKLLIAVKSCLHDRELGCHQTIRETWGRHIPLCVDLRFFVGAESDLRYNPGDDLDEINLRCVDDYDHLPDKTRKILQYSIGHGFEFTFLCDVDTFLIIPKLLRTGFEAFDYSGRFGTAHPVGTTFSFRDGRSHRHEHCHPFASGGFGYFLSRDAAKVVSETEPTMWAEDMYVGNTLGPLIQEHKLAGADLLHFENEASWHYPARYLGWDRHNMQVWMKDVMYERYRDR